MNARMLILLTLLAAASSADVTYDRLLHADREPHNWLTLLGQLLRAIATARCRRSTASNVKNLQLKWSYHPLYAKNTNAQNKMENTPLVVDGIMYTGTALEVVALDAVTGREYWKLIARSIRRRTTTPTRSTKGWRSPATRCSGRRSIAI